MKRILAFGGWIALLLVSLTGCLFGLAEDLYRLPEGSPGYEDLTQRITMDMVLLLGGFVPCLPYLPLGTETLAQGVANVPSEAAVLLAHHGAVTWGKTLREAWYRTQALEAYCHQLWLQRQLSAEIPVLELE